MERKDYKVTEISHNMEWKFSSVSPEFLQDLRTRKLGEITVFYVVTNLQEDYA